MKTITTFASMLISGLFIFQSVNSQEINNRTFAMNLTVSKTDNFTSDNETESAPVLKKDDVVVNMAMIESFRKCYNKIQPFSLVDYFRGNGSEISVKYMAYMRVRFNNTSETSENFEKDLNTEIENINAGMISNKTFNSTVAYSDYKPADQTKANSLDEKTSDSKNQTINTDKEKSKNVKWTHIKS